MNNLEVIIISLSSFFLLLIAFGFYKVIKSQKTVSQLFHHPIRIIIDIKNGDIEVITENEISQKFQNKVKNLKNLSDILRIKESEIKSFYYSVEQGIKNNSKNYLVRSRSKFSQFSSIFGFSRGSSSIMLSLKFHSENKLRGEIHQSLFYKKIKTKKIKNLYSDNIEFFTLSKDKRIQGKTYLFNISYETEFLNDKIYGKELVNYLESVFTNKINRKMKKIVDVIYSYKKNDRINIIILSTKKNKNPFSSEQAYRRIRKFERSFETSVDGWKTGLSLKIGYSERFIDKENKSRDIRRMYYESCVMSNFGYEHYKEIISSKNYQNYVNKIYWPIINNSKNLFEKKQFQTSYAPITNSELKLTYWQPHILYKNEVCDVSLSAIIEVLEIIDAGGNYLFNLIKTVMNNWNSIKQKKKPLVLTMPIGKYMVFNKIVKEFSLDDKFIKENFIISLFTKTKTTSEEVKAESVKYTSLGFKVGITTSKIDYTESLASYIGMDHIIYSNNIFMQKLPMIDKLIKIQRMSINSDKTKIIFQNIDIGEQFHTLSKYSVSYFTGKAIQIPSDKINNYNNKMKTTISQKLFLN
jgi:hypothetical protein